MERPPIPPGFSPHIFLGSQSPWILLGPTAQYWISLGVTSLQHSRPPPPAPRPHRPSAPGLPPPATLASNPAPPASTPRPMPPTHGPAAPRAPIPAPRQPRGGRSKAPSLEEKQETNAGVFRAESWPRMSTGPWPTAQSALGQVVMAQPDAWRTRPRFEGPPPHEAEPRKAKATHL